MTKIVGGKCLVCLLKWIFGHIRQLVDSLPYKEEVGGSSPSMPTTLILDLRFWILDLESEIRQQNLRSRSSVG